MSATKVEPREYVVVLASGDVSWMRPVLLTTRCNVDATYFPFDHQTCYISVKSRDHTSEAIMISDPKMVIEAYLLYGGSEEFKLDKYYATHQLVLFSSSPRPYSTARFYVELERYV